MRNSNKIYSVGTTVYFEGDDAVRGGYGKITDTYLGEEAFTVTLEDGRVIPHVTPADFETPVVLGNQGTAEFHIVDTFDDSPWSEEEIDLAEGWAVLTDRRNRDDVVPEIQYLY